MKAGKPLCELVKRIALHLNIPFTVGGGIGELKDIEALLAAGADKVSLNTAAIRNPGLDQPDGTELRKPVCCGGH